MTAGSVRRSAAPDELDLPDELDVLGVVDRFNAGFAAHDVDAVMATMTADCVFESTEPPDGRRHEGSAAVRRAWEELFAGAPGARFTSEQRWVDGDHVIVAWRYDWADPDTGRNADSGHVRGIDVFVVRDGLVAEKRSYVKG